MPKKRPKTYVTKRERAALDAAKAARKPAGAAKAKRKRGRPRAPRHHEDYMRIAGDMPTDDLAVASRAYRILAFSLEKIMTDPHITEANRRHEMRITAKAMGGLIPAARLQAAEESLRKGMEDTARDRKDPELTPHAQSDSKPSRSLRLDS